MRLRWVVFWAVATVAFAMLITSMYNEFRRQDQLVKFREEQLAQLEKAQKQVERMRDRVDFFKTEEGQAWIAREKLNMALPGEEIYRVETPLSQDREK